MLYELANSYVPFTGLPGFDRFITGEAAAPSTSEPHTTETLETSTFEPPLRSVRDRSPTPFAMRPHRQRPTLPSLPSLQFIQLLVLTLFLEESHSRIFRREIYNYPDELKYGVTQVKNRKNVQSTSTSERVVDLTGRRGSDTTSWRSSRSRRRS